MLQTKTQVSENRLLLFSNCAICGKKKSTFIKNKELNNDIGNYQFKKNKIVHKFLLTGDKFVRELHLKQPRFTYSACGPFNKHCESLLCSSFSMF